MHCEQAETLLALLIDDELEAEQKTQLTAHLAECPACSEKLSEMRAAATMLKEAVEAGQPPVLSDKRREALMEAATAPAGQHDEKMAAAASGRAASKPKATQRFFSKKWRGMNAFLTAAAAAAFVIVLSGILLPSLRYARDVMTLNNLKQAPAPASPPERLSCVVARTEVLTEPEETEEDSDAWGGGAGDYADKHVSVTDQMEEATPNSKARATGGGKLDVAKPRVYGSEVKGYFGEIGGSTGGGKVNLPAGRGEISNGYQSKSRWSVADGTVAQAPAVPPPPTRVLNEPPLDLVSSPLPTGGEKASPDADSETSARQRFRNLAGKAPEPAGSSTPGIGSGWDFRKQTVTHSTADSLEGKAAVGGRLDERGGASHRLSIETRDVSGTAVPPKPGKRASAETAAPLALPAAPARRSEKKGPPSNDEIAAPGMASVSPVEKHEPAREAKAKSGGGVLGKLVSDSELKQIRRQLENVGKAALAEPDGKEVALGEKRTDEFGIPADDAPWKAGEGGSKRQDELTTNGDSAPVSGKLGEEKAGLKGPASGPVEHRTLVAKGHSATPKAEEKPAFVRAPSAQSDRASKQYDAGDITLEIKDFPGNLQALRDRIDSTGEEASRQLDVAKLEESIKSMIAPGAWESSGEAAAQAIPPVELPAASTFKAYPPNPFVMTQKDRFSTFGLDVDTASYVLARNYIRGGKLPPPASVRPEEFINAFDYNYPKQTGQMFAVNAEGMQSPFRRGLVLLKIGVQGKVIGRDGRKPAHLVFVIDASGSMARADRLPLVQEALAALVSSLQPADRVSIVTYATDARLVLQARPVSAGSEIIAAMRAIQCGGSTNLLQGIELGYEVAQSAFRAGETNRVILCSDGVANVGLTDADEMLRQVEQYKRQGISFMSVGFGMGSYNDELMQKLANRGDGSYVFIDTPAEAHRVMTEQIAATLQTIAKDAKIQVEFNPASVRRYRLIGYEKRDIADEDFRNDAIDAGEVGSGQSSTAIYEIELLEPEGSLDLGTVFVRYRNAETGKVEEISTRLEPSIVANREAEEAPRLYLAAGVAQFAEILRESEYARGGSLDDVRWILGEVAVQLPLDQRVRELRSLVGSAKGLPKAE
ncbi:MAG TPA: von Willebrand factor type A domain-containing protein [Planctomycetota bacterium]|nr:von Willebrand factor type A domain-containing protein [Planctomycetota bacterium]